MEPEAETVVSICSSKALLNRVQNWMGDNLGNEPLLPHVLQMLYVP